ncbi:MAG: hypothetical protein PHX05_07665 [Acidobacteriota bacterium]|nr:hypothetical protein [Acidobacteriota bacterium]
MRRIRSESDLTHEDYGVERRQIRYSEAGLQKIGALLAKNNAKEASAIMGSAFAAPAKKDEPKPAVVKTVYVKNTRFLEAMMGDTLIVVRVRVNKFFLPGMELGPAGLVHAGGNMWDYVGRLPRARGVW